MGDAPGSNIVARAFVNAWRNFVWLLAGGISSLGVVVPLAAATWVAVLLVRRLRQR